MRPIHGKRTQFASIFIIDRFASSEDPRMERAKKRELEDLIAICAIISGADGCVHIETFGNANIE